MTFRQDYYENSTGLNAQLIDAFTNGQTLVTTNATVISSALQTAASQGNTTFTVNLVTIFKPTALRLRGLLMDAYLAGVTQQLGTNNIFGFECIPALNTLDSMTLSVDLNFTFQVT